MCIQGSSCPPGRIDKPLSFFVQDSYDANFHLSKKSSTTAIPKMATEKLAYRSASVFSTASPQNPKPWERTGFFGSVSRFWRITQRYIWDDPDKPKEER
jgi:hypothetical protein